MFNIKDILNGDFSDTTIEFGVLYVLTIALYFLIIMYIMERKPRLP